MDKQNRKQFGVTGQPIVAAQAYTRDMPFDHPNVKTRSWFLITPDQKLVQVNTYDGNAGRNYNAADFTQALPTGKDLERKLRGYSQVAIKDCPVASEAPSAPVAPKAK